MQVKVLIHAVISVNLISIILDTLGRANFSNHHIIYLQKQININFVYLEQSIYKIL